MAGEAARPTVVMGFGWHNEAAGAPPAWGGGWLGRVGGRGVAKAHGGGYLGNRSGGNGAARSGGVAVAGGGAWIGR